MKDTDLLIAHSNGIYNIKVAGRANFEYGMPLRDLGKTLENEDFHKISIDLTDCQCMDSTFMGIMAMLGMKAKKFGAEIEIANTSKENYNLLSGLGLQNLFTFVKHDRNGNVNWNGPQNAPADKKLTQAETVVEAHETLMDVDQKNVPVFAKVVELAKKDLETLKRIKEK